MIIFIAVGIEKTMNIFQKKVYKFTILIVILLIYLFSLLNFLNIYLFQYPLKGYSDFPIRVLSRHISLSSQKGQEVLVYSPRSYDIFKKYLFYTNSLKKDTIYKIRENLSKKEYGFNNVKFLSCDDKIDPLKMNKTVIYDIECAPLDNNYSKIIIPRLDDGGETYQIYNDQVCSNFILKSYPFGIKLSDFNFKNLDIEKFCKTFITSF